MKYVQNQIQYIEFLTPNVQHIRRFYTEAFGWKFTDYGDAYTAFEGEHVDGGFAMGAPKPGSVLVILYSKKLEETRAAVQGAGGTITKDIFSFPGGRRFHFTDPDGNELAVWSDI